MMLLVLEVGGLWSFSRLVAHQEQVSMIPVSLPPVCHLIAYYEAGEMK